MAAIYLDTCMIIGLIEGDAKQRSLLKTLLPSHQIYSSELTRLEARLLAMRQHTEPALQQLERFFAVCAMVDLNRAVFELVTTLRAESHLKTPDALHLAAAIQAGCSEFWTNDKQLAKAAGKCLSVIDWAMLESWTE